MIKLLGVKFLEQLENRTANLSSESNGQTNERNDQSIDALSEKQEKLRLDIANCKDRVKQQEMKLQRN